MRFSVIYGKSRFMSFLAKSLSVFAFLITVAAADQFDEPVFVRDQLGPEDVSTDYPELPNPEPGKDGKQVDDTKLFLTRGFPFYTKPGQLSMRGGYKSYGENIDHGAGVTVGLLLELGRLGFVANVGGGAGSSKNGKAYYTDGDVKLRVRYPLGRKHVVWWGWGVDAGWHQSNENIEDYSKVGGTLILGHMRAIERDGHVQCVIHLFGKATLAGVDTTHTKSWKQWKAGRPGLGAEAFAQCGTIRFAADYEHLLGSDHWFNVLDGLAGDVDRFSAQLSKTWLFPKTNLQFGVYGKAEVTYEHGFDVHDPTDPSGNDRTVPGIFGGIEIRY